MGLLDDFRAQNPAYQNVQDDKLEDALYKKYYSHIPRSEFYQRLEAKSVASDMAKPYGGALKAGLAKLPGETAGELGRAVTDVPSEIGKQFTAGVKNVKEGLAATGPIGQPVGALQAIGGAVQAAGAPITGAARAVGGHIMTAMEHAVGTVINPWVAEKDIPEEMYHKAAQQVDTALSAAMPNKGPVNSFRDVFPKLKVPTEDAVETAINNGYATARKSKVEIRPEPVNSLKQSIVSDLELRGLNANTAGRTFNILNRLDRMPGEERLRGLEGFVRPAGRTFKVGDIEDIRKDLVEAAKTKGEDRAAAYSAIRQIDDFLAKLSGAEVAKGEKDLPVVVQALKDARDNFAALARYRTIADKEYRADLMAKSTDASMPSNKRRQQIRQVLTSERLSRGLSPEEINQAEKVVTGTRVGNVGRYVGKFSPHGVISAAPAMVGAEMFSHDPIMAAAVGATVAGVGKAGKLVGEASTARQLRLLKEMMILRSPEGKKAIEKAKTKLKTVPRPNKSSLLAPAIGASALMGQ